MFCTNCGAPIEEGNSFCTSCGAAVTPVMPEAVPEPAPTPAYEVYPAPAAAAAAPAPVYNPVPPTTVPEPAAETRPSGSHLKINMPSSEEPEIVMPKISKPASTATNGFFSAAGSLGAEASAAARPAAAPAAPTYTPAPSYTPAPAAAPPAAPAYAPPAAPAYAPPAPAPSAYAPAYSPEPTYAPPPAYTPPAEAYNPYDNGGFRDSEAPAAAARPVVNYTVNPYEYERTAEADPYPVKKKRKKKVWPWVLAIVAFALIAGLVAAWFLIPGFQDLIKGKKNDAELSFKEETVELAVGEKTDLNKLLELENVDENKIRWESSDEDQKIITGRDGKIKAVGVGTCEVEVSSVKDDDVSDTIKIVVTDPNAPSDTEENNTAKADE